MKIKNKVIFLMVFAVLAVMLFASCSKEPEKTTIEFQFIVDGESYNNLTVSSTKEFTYPTNPEKEGYIFDNWYLDSNYTQVFDLSLIESKITKGKVVLYGNFKTCNHEWGADNCSICGATAGLEYEKQTNGYVVVGTNNNNIRFVVVPPTYQGEQVVGIAANAFSQNSALETVHVSQYVSAIDPNAFAGCTALKEIYVYKENGSFSSVDGNLYSKNADRIIKYASGKSETVFEVPHTVSVIDMGCFENASYLNAVLISDGATEIKGNAFSNCDNLLCISIPESIDIIENNSIINCPLTTIYCKNSSAANDWQSEWNKEECTVEWSTEVGITSDSLLYSISNGSATIVTCLSDPVSITIPQNIRDYPVEKISDNAFTNSRILEIYNLSNLNIEIGSTENGNVAYYALCVHKALSEQTHLHKTGDGYVFYSNEEQNVLAKYEGTSSNITLPDAYNGVKYSIGTKAFAGNSTITHVTIPDGILVGTRAFANCTNLIVANVNSTATMYSNAFADCANLKEVKIASGTVNANAFANCVNLSKVTIEESVSAILINAFSGCTSIETIVWNPSDLSLLSTSLSIPSIYVDGQALFASSEKFSTLYIGENVTDIPKNVFSECTTLKTIYWNAKEFTVATNAIMMGQASYPFANCTSLTKVYIGESVAKFSSCLFKGCTSLESVEFESTYGWKRSQPSNIGGMSSVTCDVSNAQNNAEYLKNVTVSNVLYGSGYYFREE